MFPYQSSSSDDDRTVSHITRRPPMMKYTDTARTPTNRLHRPRYSSIYSPKKYQYFPEFINLLFYFKIFIISLGIFSIFLRIYDFVTSTNSDSLINNIDYLNYIAVLILVFISSVYIVVLYNKKYYSIINEMHKKIYDTFGKTTNIKNGNQNDILKSLIFWMFIYFIILVFSILVSKFTNNLNYTTELL